MELPGRSFNADEKLSMRGSGRTEGGDATTARVETGNLYTGVVTSGQGKAHLGNNMFEGGSHVHNHRK